MCGKLNTTKVFQLLVGTLFIKNAGSSVTWKFILIVHSEILSAFCRFGPI